MIRYQFLTYTYAPHNLMGLVISRDQQYHVIDKEQWPCNQPRMTVDIINWTQWINNLIIQYWVDSPAGTSAHVASQVVGASIQLFTHMGNPFIAISNLMLDLM